MSKKGEKKVKQDYKKVTGALSFDHSAVVKQIQGIHYGYIIMDDPEAKWVWGQLSNPIYPEIVGLLNDWNAVDFTEPTREITFAELAEKLNDQD